MLKMAIGFLVHKLRSLLHPKPTLLREKQPAPAFDLSDETGKQHQLKHYLGKKVVLWFFIRASTPG